MIERYFNTIQGCSAAHKGILTLKSVDETDIDTIYIERYWAVQYSFHVVLFIKLYKVVLTFKSADESLVYDHSNESYWAVLSCGTVYYAVQGGFNF